MRLTRGGLMFLFWSGVTACDPPPLADRGGECNSLSDCKPGLTCIEERCSDDISGIVGTTPTFEAGLPDGGN